jgi:hypothetical protein
MRNRWATLAQLVERLIRNQLRQSVTSFKNNQLQTIKSKCVNVCVNSGLLFGSATLTQAKDHGNQEQPAYTHLLSLNLPSDIAVWSDPALKNQTTEAMNWWADRLHFSWHFAPKKEAEIRVIWEQGTHYLRTGTLGQSWLPVHSDYDGSAHIISRESWVVAHEIGHALGFQHVESGLMRPSRKNSLDMGVTDKEIHMAALIRMTGASKHHVVPDDTSLQASASH